MAGKLPHKARDEETLFRAILSPDLTEDPEAFVEFLFPWREKGTPLENHSGPRKWQRECLREIADHAKDCRRRAANNLDPEVFREAVAAGRGPGKSALVAWLIHFMMSTRIGSTTIVAANTEDQLKSKTWAELGRWHTLAINSHWFERNTLSLRPAPWFEALVKKQLKIDTGYYYALAQLWSEDNPDAFAGAHNPLGIQVIFDEASGIAKPIWRVTEGFFTEPVPDRYWWAFSNPRRNTGSFFECFHADRDRWRRRQIDSRTVEGTDTAVLQEIVDKYGEDSDEARVEVKGQFPRTGDKQFISRELVEQAMKRELFPDEGAALVMAIDVARFGSASSVIRFRKGRDARSIPAQHYKGVDTMQLAAYAARAIDQYKPDAVFIDGNGVGGGVVDRLRQMRYKVFDVQAGSTMVDDKLKYVNKRAEMWDRMREWLLEGCLDDNAQMRDDLVTPEKKYDAQDRLLIESKESMMARGFHSPDDGDALAMTFAERIARRDSRGLGHRGRRNRIAQGVDENAFGA